MLIEIAERSSLAKPNDPIWTTTIMTYELGSLIRGLTKARNKKAFKDEAGERAYLAEARIECADLITQTYLLAEQMDWDIVDLENEGKARFERRMKEYNEDMAKGES